jgi:peptide/nickel transport system substrate-binding protein
MIRPSRTRRLVAATVAAAAVFALALAPARHGLGQQQPAPTAPPAPKELMAAAPFDKLTLVDNATFQIEPISPRPLPAYEATKKASETKGKRDNSADRESAKEGADDGSNPDEVIIHLIDGDQRDYKVKRSNIKSVEYWEDMLLAEGERLVLSRNFPKAFEYYLAVQARNPNWPGLSAHVDRLLFEEGSWALAGNERDRGLRLLRELHRRRPDFPGLGPKLAEAYAGEVEDAAGEGAFAHGRKILHDLQTVTPDSPLIPDLKNRFLTRAKDLAANADRVEGPERLDLLARSLQIWPDQEDVRQKYREEFERLPTLEVGVVDVPRPAAPWVNSPAAARVTPLLYQSIIADESDDALLGKKPGQLSDGLELGDLGRRIDVRLRRGVPWSDGSRQVSIIDVVRTLSDRAQPRSPAYNARWASLLDRIEAEGPDTISVRLTRTPLSPTWWLVTPVGPAHASWDGRVSTPTGRVAVGDGLYTFVSGSNDELVMAVSERPADAPATPVAAAPAPDLFGATEAPPEIPRPKVLRIREVRLPDATSAMVALDRGEVAMLELVPPDRVEGLRSDPEFRVGRYRLPSLHRIAVDGRNPALQSRFLRRGMAYAIDRKAILEEVVLRRPIDEVNRPSDGPFAADSYANAPGVEPYEGNLLLAKSLIAGSRRELQVNRLKFTLQYPARPDVQAAVPRIAEALRNAGLEIELVERPESELEQDLRAGKPFDLAYRVSRCEEPVYETGPLLCPGYDAPPESQGLSALASPRIMQLLLQLEHAPEWATARALATQIDRECRDELPVIPLWQLQDHYAWRTRVKGPDEVTDHLYQGIERWEIEPWFARDVW